MTKELQHALALRELCCADFDRAQRWLRETEIQISPETVLTSAGVNELDKSLQEADYMSDFTDFSDTVLFWCLLSFVGFFRDKIDIYFIIFNFVNIIEIFVFIICKLSNYLCKSIISAI